MRKTILKLAKKNIEKKKLKHQTKQWMTAEISEAIRKRNELRKSVAQNRKEWIDSCRKTTIERIRRWNQCHDKFYPDMEDDTSHGRQKTAGKKKKCCKSMVQLMSRTKIRPNNSRRRTRAFQSFRQNGKTEYSERTSGRG